MKKKILGIDVGGSGIKGAIVHTKKGKLLTKRVRIETPEYSTPENVAEVIGEIVNKLNYKGVVGLGFPAVVQNGVTKTAANINNTWVDENINKSVSDIINLPVFSLNDADAAGIAEMKFGVGKKNKGVVLLLTVGTGIGSVLFSNGQVVPNTELGHVIFKGMDAEVYASDNTRKNEDLSWEAWGSRFNEYLHYLESLFWPDLIIIGGGVSKKLHLYKSQLDIKTPIKVAELLNNAGIVGAAVAARNYFKNN